MKATAFLLLFALAGCATAPEPVNTLPPEWSVERCEPHDLLPNLTICRPWSLREYAAMQNAASTDADAIRYPRGRRVPRG